MAEKSLREDVEEMHHRGYDDEINPQKAAFVYPIYLNGSEENLKVTAHLHARPYDLLEEAGYMGSEAEAQREAAEVHEGLVEMMKSHGLKLHRRWNHPNQRGLVGYKFIPEED